MVHDFFFFLWSFYPIPDHGLPLQSFKITLRHATVSKIPLDKWSANAETSTWQHTTLATDIHVSNGIRTRNPIKRVAADQRLRRSDHRDQLKSVTDEIKFNMEY